MGSMEDVVFMDQVKRSARGLAGSFWMPMAGGVPVPPAGEDEGEGGRKMSNQEEEWTEARRDNCRVIHKW